MMMTTLALLLPFCTTLEAASPEPNRTVWDRTGKAGWMGWDGLTSGPDYGDDLVSNGSLVLAPVLVPVLGAGAWCRCLVLVS